MGPTGRRRAAALGAVATALVLPAGAGAEVTEVALDRGTLEIRASDEADRVEIAAGGRSVVIDDPDGVPVSEAPCKGGSPSSVIRCPRSRVDSVAIDLGDADDSFDGDGDLPFAVEGDRGNDRVDGGDARDLLEGKFGDDEIDGSAGADRVLGGVDDDVLYGKAGRDEVDGGPGEDSGDGGAGRDRCFGLERQKSCE